MRLLDQAFNQGHPYALGVVQVDATGGKALQEGLISIKWHLWHGNAERAAEKTTDLDNILVTHQNDQLLAKNYSKLKPMARLITDFQAYLEQNSASLVDYSERQRCGDGERVSTGFGELAVNQVLAKRFVKRQQTQWKGAHFLVQARTKVLNEEWEECFRPQYPGFWPLPIEPMPMAA